MQVFLGVNSPGAASFLVFQCSDCGATLMDLGAGTLIHLYLSHGKNCPNENKMFSYPKLTLTEVHK